jgi:hypothetical protein
MSWTLEETSWVIGGTKDAAERLGLISDGFAPL